MPASGPAGDAALAAKVTFPEFKEWYLKLLLREAATSAKVSCRVCVRVGPSVHTTVQQGLAAQNHTSFRAVEEDGVIRACNH